MAKVRYPLFSGDVHGDFGKMFIVRKGGIVSKYFIPRDPKSAKQLEVRARFLERYVANLSKEQADLLYAAIVHFHDERYSPLDHAHDHGSLSGLSDDDHAHYFNQARGDDRYAQLLHGHSSIYALLDHLHDSSYAGASHNHNSVYSLLSHLHGSSYSSLAAFEDHKARHKWLGADQLDIRDLMMNSYPAVFKDWADISGFTASHTNSGSFTTGLVQGTPATGTTNNSRCCLYGNASLALIGYGPFLANFRTRINPSTVMTNCTVWLGLLSNPTAPTATEHHAAFKIAEGLIYASCGNGTNGNLTSTGVSIGQYGIADLFIKEKAGSIEYYVNGILKVTFNTYLPNDGITPRLTFYMLNSTGANRTMALFPYWFMQGTG